MVLRKPYAFIIKNFKKIHILLLVLSIYTLFKDNQVMTFVGSFIDTNSYNPMFESIRDYISLFNYLILLCLMAITGVLIFVLHHKKKPWKAYLLPFFDSGFLFFVLMSISGYFNHYGDESTLVTIRTLAQLLQIGSLLQYAVFILLFIRITGLDLKKFDFVHDQEYLEIKEEDREEFEVNVEIDKDSITRFFKKQARHAKYLYQEHPLVFHCIFAILLIGIGGYCYYYFGVLHKTYREGDVFSALSYQITIQESYWTDKDYRGEVINPNKDYVALVIRMKNNGATRAISAERFHLLNKNHLYQYTHKEDTAFKDLGNTYPKRELRSGEETVFYLVYEVDKKLNSNQFVLYYQDITNQDRLLRRKVKITPQDLHQEKVIDTKKINETLTVSGIGFSKKKMTLTNATIDNQATYSLYECPSYNHCSFFKKTVQNPTGKILSLSFDAASFEDKDFVDFSMAYGKIEYKDSNQKTKTIALVNAVEKEYEGTKLYLKIPTEVEASSSIQLVYTIRNRQFVYVIK